MKKLLFLIAAAMLYVNAAAQEKFTVVAFDAYSHDFGSINEADGKVSHTFTFTNKGKYPFVITSVSVTCGCTQPEFSKAPVPSGGTGTIKITYDPKNRPGEFKRQVYVISNTEEKSITLTIEGNVKGKPRTIEEDYPEELASGLRIVSLDNDIGNIPRGKVTWRNIGIANAGNSAAKIEIKGNLPGYLTVFPVNPLLGPGERSEIRVSIDGSKTDKWGVERIRFTPVVNSVEAGKSVEVKAVFVEDFSGLTYQQKTDAPVIEFSSYFYHFSQQKRGAALTQTFEFHNSGKSDLIIRKIDTTSPMVTAESSKKTLKPGDQAIITVKIDTRNAPLGRFAESVYVISNDPVRPAPEIRVMATITE